MRKRFVSCAVAVAMLSCMGQMAAEQNALAAYTLPYDPNGTVSYSPPVQVDLFEQWEREGYPEYVGGTSSSDGTLSNYNLYLTENTEEKQQMIREQVPDRIGLTFYPCKYSHNHLKQVMNEIANNWKDGYGIVGWGYTIPKITDENAINEPRISVIIVQENYEETVAKLTEAFGDAVYPRVGTYPVPDIAVAPVEGSGSASTGWGNASSATAAPAIGWENTSSVTAEPGVCPPDGQETTASETAPTQDNYVVPILPVGQEIASGVGATAFLPQNATGAACTGSTSSPVQGTTGAQAAASNGQSTNSNVASATEALPQSVIKQSVKLSGAGKTKGMKATLKNGTVTLKWKASGKITKYKVRVSSSKKFTSETTTTSIKKSAAITMKKAPSVCYVQMKNYQKKTKKWSKWGKTIKVQIVQTETQESASAEQNTAQNAVVPGTANSTQKPTAPNSTNPTQNPSAINNPTQPQGNNSQNVVYDTTVAGITFKTVENTATSIKLELTNGNATELVFGEDYYIEKLENGSWVPVPEQHEHIVPAIACVFLGGKTGNLSYKWEQVYGSLEAGEYRFVKEFSQAGNAYKIAAGFRI